MTDDEIRLHFGEMTAGEMRTARAIVAWFERKADTDTRALSDLLQDCLALFKSIAVEDDSGCYEIDQRDRKWLDALCVKIKAET